MRKYIDMVVEAALAALMAIMCIVVFLGVFYRYVLLDPLTWTEEVGRICLIWTTFFGSYLAYRRNVHISMDLALRYVGEGGRRVLHLVCLVLMGAFMAMLIIQGSSYSSAFLSSRTPILEFSLGMVYAALPLGAAFILISLVIDLYAFARGGMRLEASPEKGDAI